MDSIIFDVDGTLWDSTDKVAGAWKLTAQNMNLPFEHITGERLKKEFGKPMDVIGKSLFPDLPVEDAVNFINVAGIQENKWLLTHHPSLYEGVFTTLKELSARMPLFIVSNCQAGYIEVLLETTGLTPFIKDHLCPDDTGLVKAPNIQAIVEKYNLQHPVYIGDTAGDLTASREAGVPFIYASYGFGTVNEYDAIIEKPADILDITL